MQRLSLRFYHSDLEQQYQCTRNRVRFQMFWAVSICYLILSLILLIENYKTPHFQLKNSKEFYLILVILLLQIFGGCLKQQIRYAICVLNVIGSLMQISLQNLQSDQTIFIFGCNLMSTKIFLLKRSDFFLSVIQLACVSTIRITILVYSSGFDLFSGISTILVSFFICAVIFNSERRKRQQFLFNLKESHQEQLLFSIIQKPFYYFEYDHTSFFMKSIKRKEDIPIYKKEFCQDCNLKYLLREYMYQNVTLEDYLLKRAISRAPLLQGFHMICQNKRKGRIYVTLDELFSDSHSYLLIFNSQPQQQQSYTKSRLLMLNYSKDVIKSLTLKKPKKIFSLSVSYLSVIYNNDYTISKFNPGKLLKSILNLLQGGKRYLIIDNGLELNIFAYKNLFIVSWLQIISILLSTQKKYTEIKIVVTDLYIEFTIPLTQQHQTLIKKNKVLCQIFRDLYKVEYDPFRIKMYKDLDISFNEYYLK